MVAPRVGLSALLLATVAASASCQGFAALAGLGAAAGSLAKGAMEAGGLAKGAAPLAAAATGLAANVAASGGLAKGGYEGLGGLLGIKGESEKKKEGENSVVVPTKSQDKTEIKPPTDIGKAESEGFLGTKTPTELLKLLLNPFDLSAKIAEHFKLHFDKFFPVVSKGFNFGFELAVQPLVLSLKIIEKVFVPDSCKLRFACELTRKVSWLRDILPKLSDKVLSQSKIFKALSDGIHNDCHTIYECNGDPKLKDEFKDNHKSQNNAGDKHQHEAGHKHEGKGKDEHGDGLYHEGQDESHGEGHHEGGYDAFN